QMKDRAEIGRSWLDQVKDKCPEVRFTAHYALLGEFDFLDIYEAPDEQSAAKVSIISQANGAFQAQSLPAIPYKKYLELIKEIE
ncbi:MAG: GYD domain-containing protein, partial [Bacteroidales bacterium]